MSSSFNEARADSPGKWPGRPGPATDARAGFNEARADSPGKYSGGRWYACGERTLQ